MLVAFALVQSIFSSGVILGWAPFLLILKSIGAFSSQCPSQDFRTVSSKEICSSREVSLNAMFTVGILFNFGGSLPVGYLLDRQGPKRTNIFATVSSVLGLLLLAGTSLKDAASSNAEVAFFIGFALIAIGGRAQWNSLLHISNLFAGNKSQVISLLSGAFMCSAFVLAIVLELFNAGVALHSSLFFLAGIVFLLGVAAAFVIPSRSFKPNSAFSFRKTDATNRNNTEMKTTQEKKEEKKKTKKSEEGMDIKFSEMDLGQCFRQFEFWGLVLFLTFQLLALNYYLGTIGKQLLSKGDTDERFTIIFSFMVPVSIISLPPTGFLLDRRGFPPVLVVAILFNTLMTLLLFAGDLRVQVFGFLLYACGRGMTFACFYSFMGIFGFKHYGVLSGVGVLIASLFGFVQIPLLAATLQDLEGDFRPINGLLTALTAICLAVPLLLYRKYRICRQHCCLLRNNPQNDEKDVNF